MAGSSEDVGNDNRQPITRSPANSSASGLGASAAPEKAGSLNKKIRTLIKNKKIRTLIKMIAVTLAFSIAAAVVWWFRAPSGSVSRNDRSQVIQIPANGFEQVGSYLPGSINMTYEIKDFDPETGIVNGSLSFPFWQILGLPKPLYLNGIPVTRTPPLNAIGINDSQEPITSMPYQVVATGTAAAFPSDSYRVRFPVELSYKGHLGLDYVSNHSLTVRSGPRTNSYVVEAPDKRHRDTYSADTGFLTLLITRKTPDIVWYYAIAVVPAVLILALVWQLVSGGSRITLEAGIGILAILSLRQVIVPANIHTITRIDLLLGIEAVVMILLVTWGALQKPREE